MSENDALKDIIIPVIVGIIGFVGATIAVFWKRIETRNRGRVFEKLILRELEEISPYPEHSEAHKKWFDHVTKGEFIHQKIINDPTQNRDFILSIDPSLLYLVNQLWSSFRTGDGNQWLYYLRWICAYPKIPVRYRIFYYLQEESDFDGAYMGKIVRDHPVPSDKRSNAERYEELVLEACYRVVQFRYDKKREIYEAYKKWKLLIDEYEKKGEKVDSSRIAG